jgi:hypothetical protein
MIHLIASDKDSGDSFSRSVEASTVDEFRDELAEFELDCGFRKYDIHWEADEEHEKAVVEEIL